MIQSIIHYSLHFLAPGLIAWIFFRRNWKQAWLIMLASMFIDLDHLLADPIFSATRCSIGFHPLHSYLAIGTYFVMFFIRMARILAIGLLLHIATDYLDCLWMS